jgi:hypothetical protein
MYKISTVAADTNHTSLKYTCHDIKIHHHINPPNPDKWVNLKIKQIQQKHKDTENLIRA